jgi:hypothetical protein
MTTIRRWYIFSVCAISLQSVTWALIALLRNLFTNRGNIPETEVAFSISIVLIVFPIYLVHWFWAGRLASHDDEERGSLLRRVYLYGMMAGFLFPFFYNAQALIEQITAMILKVPALTSQYSFGTHIAQDVLALIPLGLFWFYHYRQTKTDEGQLAPEMTMAVVRRLYVLFFSAFGVLVACFNSVNLLRQMLRQFAPPAYNNNFQFSSLIAWVLISIALWVIHWAWAQRLFAQENAEEKASGLRKFTLYALVFIGVMGVVVSLTAAFAGMLRRILGLTPEGDLRDIASVAIVLGVLWAYHARQIQHDSRQASEAPHQAAIRRLYRYLVAGVGLMAFLIGVGGDISVLIRGLSGGPLNLLKDQLSWFTAALFAGLPVWFIPWQAQQSQVSRAEAAGIDESRSLVRRIYLYLFIFAATMTMLACATTVVFRLISTLLGAASISVSEFIQAISFAFIALGVWLYHGLSIRQDNARLQRLENERLAALPVVVWVNESTLTERIVEAARVHIAGINIAAATPGEGLAAQITGAGVLVLPWTMYLPERGVAPELLQAIASSPARKLLLPEWAVGWDWIGVEHDEEQTTIRHTVRALKQVLSGENVRLGHGLGVGAILAIIFGGLVLFIITTSLLSMLSNTLGL